MKYEILITSIITKIFDSKNEINKVQYVTFYSQIYSIINNLDKNENSIFETIIKKNILEIIYSIFTTFNYNFDDYNYLDIYNTYLEKAQIGDKIFLYYQNSECSDLEKKNKLISYLFKLSWDDYILVKIFPNILNNIGDLTILDEDIINKISKYHHHIDSMNKELNKVFKQNILDKIQNYDIINLDILIKIIYSYEKLLEIFNDEYYKNKIPEIINTLIVNNNHILKENIEYLFIDIKDKLYNQNIEIYNIDNKYKTFFKYLDVIETKKYIDILQKNLIHNDDNVENILRHLNLSSIIYRYLFPDYFNRSINNYWDGDKNNMNISELDIFLENTLKKICIKFDAKFNLDFVKIINKNINNTSLFKNINCIINNLADKESFIVYYKKALKSRLLNGHVKDIYNENILLNIFINNNNLLDVSRMLVMLTDYQNSLIYSNEYNALFNNNNFINLTTYDMWNITKNNYENELQCSIFKDSMNLMKNDFKTYYKINNEKTNVDFVDNISTCLIDFNNIELECNYLQADLLYLFNETEIIDLDKYKISLPLLESLIKPKIIKKSKNKIYINNNFKYSKSVLKIYKLYKPIEQQTSTNSQNKDENMLVFKKDEYIDIYIIKYLKKNKEIFINKNELYNILKEYYANKFDINEDLYSKRLDNLENNEYIFVEENTVKYKP